MTVELVQGRGPARRRWWSGASRLRRNRRLSVPRILCRRDPQSAHAGPTAGLWRIFWPGAIGQAAGGVAGGRAALARGRLDRAAAAQEHAAPTVKAPSRAAAFLRLAGYRAKVVAGESSRIVPAAPSHTLCAGCRLALTAIVNWMDTRGGVWDIDGVPHDGDHRTGDPATARAMPIPAATPSPQTSMNTIRPRHSGAPCSRWSR